MNLIKKALLVLSFSLFVFLTGCSSQMSADFAESGYVPLKHARLRFGAFFGSPFGMRFSDPQNLGIHRSYKGPKEINGMLYTCKGGFIDVGHVREAADRTAFIKEVVYKNLMEKNTNFSFHVIEPSTYMLTMTYPQNWDNYSQAERENIANEISIDIGQYLGHTSLIWHEIISWYGFATVAPFSDKISAFSWEDPYSDIIGTYLGAAALRDMGQKYDNAMTNLLYEELQELDVQPSEVARQAAHEIQGQWYTGGFYFFVSMKLRNFDVGYDNGVVTPIRVPGICPDCQPKVYPVPSLDSLYQHGFSMIVGIEPNILQKGKIYSTINLENDKLLEPKMHFARLIEQIKNDPKVLFEQDEIGERINARQQ